MIKGLLALLVVALGCTSCSLPTIRGDEISDPFGYVCWKVEQMYGVGCGDLEPPKIVYSKYVNMRGMSYGLYIRGEKNIYINPQAPVNKKTIIEHEMTHYVLYELDLIDPKGERCESERVARLISRGDDDPWNDRVKRGYGCQNHEAPR